MHKAEIIGLERTIRLPRSAWPRQAAQALGFQDAVDRVAVEVGQEVGDHKGQVIQRKAGGATQGTDNGALLFRGFPGQLVRAAGVVLAVGSPAIAQSRPGRPGSCGLSDGSWASGPPRLRGLGTTVKAPSIRLKRPTNLIPATFRYQTIRA